MGICGGPIGLSGISRVGIIGGGAPSWVGVKVGSRGTVGSSVADGMRVGVMVGGMNGVKVSVGVQVKEGSKVAVAEGKMIWVLVGDGVTLLVIVRVGVGVRVPTRTVLPASNAKKPRQ